MPQSTESHTPLSSSVPLVAIIGPTAVGKTRLVLELAVRIGGEVVNLDSMQVYRHMDIGTAKPTPEERRLIKHHLLDLVQPDEAYNVAQFVGDAEKSCGEIGGRGRVPILTGGTGLYLRGFQEGLFTMATEDVLSAPSDADSEKIRADLQEAMRNEGRLALHAQLAQIDPVSAARIHPNDSSRLLRALEVYALTGQPWSKHLTRQKAASSPTAPRKKILKIGLTGERQWLYERINLRTAQMLQEGLLGEVKKLLEMGFSPTLKPMQAIGYRHVVEFLAGQRDLAKTQELMARDTRHYAKRQFTWFNRDPEITWFRPDQLEEIAEVIEEYLDNFRINNMKDKEHKATA